MKLVLKNIGVLHKAEITLHNLCLIAGENDNGKSTIGKIVFCMVKAINRYREDLQETKENQLDDKIEEIYFFLRKNIDHPLPEMRDFMFDLRRIHRIELYDRVSHFENLIDKVLVEELLTAETKNELQVLKKDLLAIKDEPEDLTKSIENALNKAFASEFDASLLRHGAEEGEIQLLEDDLILIHLLVDGLGVRLVGEVEPIVLKDATFIDSPLILNQHDLLIRSQTLLDVDKRSSRIFGTPYTTLHTKDLFNKLLEPTLSSVPISPDNAAILNEIKEITVGEIRYERNNRDFMFYRSDKSISIKNTASGIKVFGLLQILLNNESISKNTVLILDEPENHLHPKWQLKLAQVLIKLIENGVMVMIASHSPYLIEALKRGVDRVGISEQAGFALAENGIISDENRLSDIFDVLAEPFEQFSRMDAEDLRDE